MIQIPLVQLPPASSILAGAEIGASHATILRQLALEAGQSTVQLVLDVEGVESITASYLKQVIAVFEPAALGQP